MLKNIYLYLARLNQCNYKADFPVLQKTGLEFEKNALRLAFSSSYGKLRRTNFMN